MHACGAYKLDIEDDGVLMFKCVHICNSCHDDDSLDFHSPLFLPSLRILFRRLTTPSLVRTCAQNSPLTRGMFIQDTLTHSLHSQYFYSLSLACAVPFGEVKGDGVHWDTNEAVKGAGNA
jgi:hypothetical protein